MYCKISLFIKASYLALSFDNIFKLKNLNILKTENEILKQRGLENFNSDSKLKIFNEFSTNDVYKRKKRQNNSLDKFLIERLKNRNISFTDDQIRELIEFDNYRRNDDVYAAKFYLYLHIIIPGSTKLTLDDVMRPTEEKIQELHRLHKMIVLRGTIEKLVLEKIKSDAELKSFKWQLDRTPYTNSVKMRNHYVQLENINNSFKDLIELKTKEYKDLLDIQSKLMENKDDENDSMERY